MNFERTEYKAGIIIIGMLRSAIHLSTYLSMVLQPFIGPWPLFQFPDPIYIVGRTPWMGDQQVARPLPTHRRTQAQNKRK
jgi:hypothetical protein